MVYSPPAKIKHYASVFRNVFAGCCIKASCLEYFVKMLLAVVAKLLREHRLNLQSLNLIYHIKINEVLERITETRFFNASVPVLTKG